MKSLYKMLMIFICFLFFSISFAQSNWTSFIDSTGNLIRMKINQKTGIPQRLYGLNFNFTSLGNVTHQNIELLGRRFLSNYSKLFKLKIDDLKFKSAQNVKGKWYVNFKQHYQNIPIRYADVGFVIDIKGNVMLIGSDFHPDISIDVNPTISSHEAENIAAENFHLLTANDSLFIRKEPELLILPVENDSSYDYILSYHTEIEYKDSACAYSESYFIDARNGNIFKQYSNIINSSVYGTVNIKYWPEHYYDSQQTNNCKYSRVELSAIYGGSLGYHYTNSNGYYSYSNIAYAPYVIEGWLIGTYIRLRDNSDYHSALVYPGNHSWTWNATDATNVYYHGDWIHQFFKSSPFSYNGMDYQMQAYVNQGSYYNGWADRYDIGFGSQYGQYWARSSDVVYHEYTHNTVAHLYQESGNARFIGDYYDMGYYSVGRAMDEGFADYYACTINNDNIQGESVNVNRDLDNTNVWTQNNGPWWNGTVIGGACWDLRQSLGNSYVNELVFDALQMTPHAYTFEDFAVNIAIADDNDGNLNNSVPHYDEIYQAFEVNHGITLNVPAPPDPVSVIISGPSWLGYKEFGTWTANVSDGVGPFSYQWYKKLEGQSSWTPRGTEQTQTERMYNKSFTMKVVVTDNYNDDTAEDIKYVSYGIPPKMDPTNPIVDNITEYIPVKYAISQNHPNPFNPETHINFDLPKNNFVTLIVYNIQGKKVTTLVNEFLTAGSYTTTLNGSLLASGVYIYKINAGSFSAVRRMLLIK